MTSELAPTRHLRRGLPRVAGGEPWPPSTGPLGGHASEAAPSPAPLARAGSALGTPGGGAVPVRRGLPRDPRGATQPPDVERNPSIAAGRTSAVEPAIAAMSPSAAPEPTPPIVATAPPVAPAQDRFWRLTARGWAGIALAAVLLVLALGAVLLTRWLLTTEWMQGFLTSYPGETELPAGAPVGLPAWLGWQHFFNVFLIALIIRSGLQVRNQKRPPLYWSPRGNPSRKISINLWFHQSLDILWLANGVTYVVLLFVTGQWVRVVPTSWDVIPNALSALIQYVSLNWPTENGWVNYNSLQVLAYFTTIFIAAPLAAVTGVRMSGIWPDKATTLNRIYPLEWARALHFPIMLYFVVFIIAHVALVFATGALRNLNHMYASQDVVNWAGFLIFIASLIVMAGAWIAARPVILGTIAKAFGRVSGRQ